MNSYNSYDELRESDIALFLCAKAISDILPEIHANSAAGEAICFWYIRRYAFAHLLLRSSQSQSNAKDTTFTSCRKSELFEQEVDFLQAFNSSKGIENNITDTISASSFYDEEVASISAKNCILDFLGVCYQVGGSSLQIRAQDALRLLLPLNHPSLSNANEEISLYLPFLSSLFSLENVESESINSIGSVTRNFAVWLNIAWGSLSFEKQVRLARAVSSWAKTSIFPTEQPQNQENSFHLAQPIISNRISTLNQNSFEKSGIINVSQAYAFFCDVFEGRVNIHDVESRNFFPLGSISYRSGASGENVFSVVLQILGSTNNANYSGTQMILFHITFGMLLYMQLYLSLHSLGHSRQCASMALTVGRQLGSPEILALGHYSCFLVNIATGRVPEAADSILITLQLLRSDNKIPTGSLSYLGSAQLLLFHPGCVSASLRSLLISERRMNQEDGSFNVGRDTQADKYTLQASGNTVVVETIAQTIRHALFRAEMEEFKMLDEGNGWLSLTSSIAREVILMISSLYGVVCRPLYINTVSFGSLLSQLEEEASLGPPSSLTSPSFVLLHQVSRHTAHKALLYQISALEAPSGVGPLRVYLDFCTAVKHHLGPDAVSSIAHGVFFSQVFRFLLACWLSKNGFVKSAFDLLTTTAEGLYFASGDQKSNEDGTFFETVILGMIKANTFVKGTWYWSQDHLLLYAMVQYKRAELAYFLGYSDMLNRLFETLSNISSLNYFPLGILVARIIRSMADQNRGDHASAIKILESTLESAESIGLRWLVVEAKIRMVSSLQAIRRWTDSLVVLKNEITIPSVKENLFTLMQITAELNNGSQTCADRPLRELAEEFLELLDAKTSDSIGFSTHERITTYSLLQELAKRDHHFTMDLENEIEMESKKISDRCFQEGACDTMLIRPIPDVCEDILSNIAS